MSNQKKPNIFDKLTDPKQYTGAHKERFDKDGKGKGIAGRVDDNGPKDLKNMVDSKSKPVGNSKSVKTVSKVEKVEEFTKKLENLDVKDDEHVEHKEETDKPKKTNIFDKLTDPKQYTGAHKERFDKDGKGKGLAGRVDEVAPKDLKTMVDSKSTKTGPSTTTTTTDKSKSTKVAAKVEKKDGPSIFDKLTDPKQYTGAHKERFDKDGKGKGIGGRTDNTGPKNLSNMVSTKK
jgi:hypothetical protein